MQVLGFLVPPGAGERGVPLQTLFGFERVHVKAGESVTVWLYPALTDFAIADLDGHRWAESGRQGLQPRGVTSHDDEIGPFGGERPTEGFSESGRSTGHKGSAPSTLGPRG